MINIRPSQGNRSCGTGRPTSILEIACLLARLYKKELKPRVMSSYRKGDIRHCYADVSRLEKLGFKAVVNFEKGMSNLIEWANKVEAKDMVKLVDSKLVKKGLRII